MKVRLTDQKAIEAYEKALKSTAIYRYAESYCRVSVHVYCGFTDLYIIHILLSAETLSGLSPLTTRCYSMSLSASTLGLRLSRCA